MKGISRKLTNIITCVFSPIPIKYSACFINFPYLSYAFSNYLSQYLCCSLIAASFFQIIQLIFFHIPASDFFLRNISVFHIILQIYYTYAFFILIGRIIRLVCAGWFFPMHKECLSFIINAGKSSSRQCKPDLVLPQLAGQLPETAWPAGVV